MHNNVKDQLRLWMTAVGVATLIIASLLSALVFLPELFRYEINWKWVRFTTVTVTFIGFCLKTYWRARNRLEFWVMLSGVLVLHFIGVGYFYYAGAGLPLLVFGPVVALDWALLAIGIYRFLGIGPSVHANNPGLESLRD